MQDGEHLQGDRAGPSLTAFNYESRWGQLALKATYKATMEEEGLPVMPPCCRPNMSGQPPMTLQQFLGQVHNSFFAKLWTLTRAVTHSQPAYTGLKHG